MNHSRRSFLKSFAVAAASLPVLGRLAFADELPLLKESDDSAKTQKFCVSADTPTKNCAARKLKDKKNQYCYNCQLFTRTDGDGKKGSGKCMILPKYRVTAASWCMSWIENPASKG
jgi:hypothetical protein